MKFQAYPAGESFVRGEGVAIMQHVCGHEGRYYFAGKRFAEESQKDYEEKVCFSCRSNDWLAVASRSPKHVTAAKAPT